MCEFAFTRLRACAFKNRRQAALKCESQVRMGAHLRGDSLSLSSTDVCAAVPMDMWSATYSRSRRCSQQSGVLFA